SDAAWADIEEETTRTLKRYLAGRRVVDVRAPGGVGLSAVGTGHLKTLPAPGEGILARQREVKALVELRVPFELDRQQIDDVERGAGDPGRAQKSPVGGGPPAFGGLSGGRAGGPRGGPQAAGKSPPPPMSAAIPMPSRKPWSSCASSASTVLIHCCSAPMPIPPSP